MLLAAAGTGTAVSPVQRCNIDACPLRACLPADEIGDAVEAVADAVVDGVVDGANAVKDGAVAVGKGAVAVGKGAVVSWGERRRGGGGPIVDGGKRLTGWREWWRGRSVPLCREQLQGRRAGVLENCPSLVRALVPSQLHMTCRTRCCPPLQDVVGDAAEAVGDAAVSVAKGTANVVEKAANVVTDAVADTAKVRDLQQCCCSVAAVLLQCCCSVAADGDAPGVPCSWHSPR